MIQNGILTEWTKKPNKQTNTTKQTNTHTHTEKTKPQNSHQNLEDKKGEEI